MPGKMQLHRGRGTIVPQAFFQRDGECQLVACKDAPIDDKTVQTGAQRMHAHHGRCNDVEIGQLDAFRFSPGNVLVNIFAVNRFRKVDKRIAPACHDVGNRLIKRPQVFQCMSI
ncbi:hypothetical protein SDC9_205296 [bioreactor metagenome]|uniref:Uncharacterized protein n=1 Tax=bioreactor metagenome TaxID=1076179 RepID=A0A645J3B8_9ZZZZ